jgi:hypothetical protein
MAREESFFDDLARGLADGSISRRRALGLFASSAIAALLPSTRALADDDDDDHDGYTVCHVPGRPPNCDCSRARTIRGLSRRERNRHLRNHPCDSRGNCRNNPYCGTTTTTTTTTGMCRPGAAPCTADDECCSQVCVQRRFGGECAPEPPKCDPPCPATCGCAVAADGTTTICIDCPECLIPLVEGTCEEVCCLDETSCTPLEVCLAAPPGFAACAPACTTSGTPTTTTTPMCIPDDHGSCGSHGECCSGNCSNGICCESGRVGLPNGTCALVCLSNAECPACGSFAFCGQDFSGPGICANPDVPGQACSADSGCPAGQYCNSSGRCGFVC